MNRWLTGEAKQQFSEVLRRSENEPQQIYRRDRLVAAVISADVFDEFTEYQFVQDALVNPSIGPTRAVTAAAGQWHHDLSATYNFENIYLTAGINNVANEKPPLISQEAGPNRNNAVTSARYDVIGRSYFVRVQFGF